ncbi:hypothetical protein ILYODFUR_007674 [Ilyodon furcidens]|uniref:Uncharacterized protein n=1 Tax=Ilyodon furcidens TaxID=33524 RepID=A0ABV0V150_9TELE
MTNNEERKDDMDLLQQLYGGILLRPLLDPRNIQEDTDSKNKPHLAWSQGSYFPDRSGRSSPLLATAAELHRNVSVERVTAVG